jgi:DNA-binding SARP family transcriptional activator/DNA-binding beta-propeller fold protein YncE
MEFRILGPLEVEEDGRLLKLGGAKQRAVLALLLLHANEVVSRDRLIDELWGASPPDTAQTALQVYVSQLRKELGRDAIVTQSPGYLIRVRPGELDLDRFERLVEQARDDDAPGAAARLRDALRLWRGEALADLDSVARSERARLEEQRLAALEQRIDADLELGRYSSLVPELEGLVREHPLREGLRGQLMVALYRSGRQADALDVYREGRRLLSEELGLEPREELRRLERAILEQDPSLGAARAPEEAAPSTVPMGTVTFLFTDIEGSTRLVRDLGDDYGALLEQHHRLLRETFEHHGGQEIDTQGDAFFFAFRRAREAVRAAVEAQKAMAGAGWVQGADVRIRIGIHTGEPGFAEAGYHGLDVVRAARISGAAHGGQILVSSATWDLAGDTVPDVSFRDLGEHRLKDLEQPQRIFQVLSPGLSEEFPPLRTQDAARVMTITGREEELAAAAEAALGAEEHRRRLFRRSSLIAGVGAALVLAAIVAVVIALTSGAGGVIVAPNSVALVDPESSRIAADIPVGARPVAVVVGEDAVWVASADDGTVSRIDPQSRREVSRIGVGGEVSDIAVGYGSVWVAGGNDEVLTRIDPRQNAVEAKLTFGMQDLLDPKPMFAVATGAGAVWVTRGNSVLRIDPNTNNRTDTIRVERPLAIAVGGGALWIATVSERILRVEPTTGAVTGTIPVPAQAWGLVANATNLWALIGIGGGEIWRFDPDSGTPSGTVSGADGNPIDIAIDHGALWAADIDPGAVSRADTSKGAIVETVPLGQRPTAIAVGEGGVWVALEAGEATSSGPGP